MRKDKILIIGALGQIGSELTTALINMYGEEGVVASDIVEHRKFDKAYPHCAYEHLNALDKERMFAIIDKYKITQVYHLAAILSAKGEENPHFAWRLNMKTLGYVLQAAQDFNLDKIFWPSSIAIFGENTPRNNTPQYTVTDPLTAYGISKLAGERWVEYYFQRWGTDVRSIRYPGLISYKTLPGGGTTDYAVDIYYHALHENQYNCFLKEDTYLPMMYMPDAIRATLELMEADADKVKIRSSYNVSGMSFSPKEITQSIKKHLPTFEIYYEADFRQAIADSWPNSIDDTRAREDWGWKPNYDLDKMTADMLEKLNEKDLSNLMDIKQT